MDLTWNKGYDDYQDTAWPVRKDALTDICQNVTLAAAGALDNEQLAEHLELMEELMRYYTYSHDFQNLEPLMRSYEPMLGLLRDRNPDTAGYWYLEMEYARINALLYLDQGRAQQAINHYDQALSYGEHCFSRLQADSAHYSQIQRLYLAWACAECRSEAALTCEKLLDSGKMLRILQDTLPLLEYLESCFDESPGIVERTADVYARIGAACYQYNDIERGEFGYDRAERLYGRLAEDIDSDFNRARRLWIRGLHGADAFLRTGNAAIMGSCETELQEYLASNPQGRDYAIAQGALAMLYMQKGGAIQQSGGNIEDAIGWTEKSIDLFGQAQKILEEDIDDLLRDIAKNTIIDITARIYGSYASALDVLGVQYFAAGRSADAKGAFEQVLSMVTDSGRYSLAETAVLLLRAESCQYLALIATEDSDSHKIDFYCTQAMDFGEEAAKKTGNPAAWQIVVISASLAAEAADMMKEKQKMGEYAARGLAACDQLARVMPGSEILSMRAGLEKREKKSKRRFF